MQTRSVVMLAAVSCLLVSTVLWILILMLRRFQRRGTAIDRFRSLVEQGDPYRATSWAVRMIATTGFPNSERSQEHARMIIARNMDLLEAIRHFLPQNEELSRSLERVAHALRSQLRIVDEISSTTSTNKMATNWSEAGMELERSKRILLLDIQARAQ